MTDDDIERLAARIDTLERTLTEAAGGADGPTEPPRETRPDDLESRLEDLEDRLAEVEAAVQALRGYVGHLRHVNDEVERRADAALAAVDDPASRDVSHQTASGREGAAAPAVYATDGGGERSLEELTRLVGRVRDSL